jgi:hypothetical protein
MMENVFQLIVSAGLMTLMKLTTQWELIDAMTIVSAMEPEDVLQPNTAKNVWT